MPFSPAFARFVLLTLLVSAPSAAQTSGKFWIRFGDKGSGVPSDGALRSASGSYRAALAEIDPRAIARRAKVLPRSEIFSVSDLPVAPAYLDALQALGVRVIHESRWMNAVSARLTDSQRNAIAALPFVSSVDPVRSFPRRPRESRPAAPPLSRDALSFDYGSSLEQLRMIDAVPLQAMGVTGHGVLVGMLDSGFRWRLHEALKSRRVVAEHDFIFNDDTTANQAGDIATQDEHGTLTLSLIGAYAPGILLGSAFDASFLLGKTEDIRSETRVEEDNWVAGIEWMERKGVDVVSSSLGYNVFDDGTGYSWAAGDFNGRTSVTARAAAHAAELGVIVCNAMGNEDNGDGITGTMLTPADADSIISVGAVNLARQLEPFSSTGPTNDGRTKPDLVAPGSRGMVVAIPPNNYSAEFQGTSLSTPLVAGAAALLLSVRPELTPIQVRDALRASADTVDAERIPTRPNNFTGWGLVDAFRAALSFGPIFSNTPSVAAGGPNRITINILSAFGLRSDSVIFRFAPGRSTSFGTAPMVLDSSFGFPTSGRYIVTIPSFPADTLLRFTIEAVDSAGNRYASPPPITGREWELHVGRDDLHLSPDIPAGDALFQNYPNPVNGWTTIAFDLPRDEGVTLELFDIRGALVATLLSGPVEAGTGRSVMVDASRYPSGVYFYRLRSAHASITKKLVILR